VLATLVRRRGGKILNSESEQKEREREVLPLSGALTALCEKRFGFALKLGRRLHLALDHSRNDFLHQVRRDVPEVVLRKSRHS